MDANHGLPPFDENVREYHTAKTASNKRKSDDGIHDSSTHKLSASSVALGNRTESGINVTFGLPPWIETKFSETGETSEKNSNQYHLGAPFVQVSGLSPTPPRKDTDCKALRSVSLSAVGTPTVAESRTLPPAETKDTAATGDTDIDSPCSRKIPSASERPESPFAPRDVSVIPWTDCYPDDPDKARELATSTGVPGLQIYSVCVFTHATSDTQVLDEVDATQDSDNFRVEMGKQISPERPSVPGTKKPYDKFETKSSAETWDTDVDFDLNEGSRKMTEEDLGRLGLQSWWKEDLSDVTTGLPLISKEDLPGLENVCESLFSVGRPAAEDSGEHVADRKTGIDRGRRRPPTANASSLLEMKVDPSIDAFGTTNQQGSPGHTLPSASSDSQPQKATQEPQPNDSVRASSVTDSELADGCGWVKVEMETENPGQTDNV
ncbi:hypothetical protein E5D57_010953 [Metarhizium anisopliae]|nr:hypothetical protein E5D57_010953 [Metarhizium anisopliae]